MINVKIVCFVCRKPIKDGYEMNNRHDCHEAGCSREGCDCDLVCHSECCPDCNASDEHSDLVCEEADPEHDTVTDNEEDFSDEEWEAELVSDA